MVRFRMTAIPVILILGCHGPVRIDYEAVVGQAAAAGRDTYREIPLRRFALSARGSLERRLYERVEQAVELANRFIDSEDNHHFPPGRRFRASEDGKLTVESDAGDGFRMRLYVTCGMTFLSQFDFSAQEGIDGFSVGAVRDVYRRPVDVSIANTLFFTLEGKWRSAEMLAALLLHETSHTLQVRGQGQVSYWLEYYLRGAVLAEGGEEWNELEKVPYRVETEFWRWWAKREG
ncbi:MAG: hypothetical protein HYY16_06775 [Planctomycetes bacterium]|nr:hypothetical protein [Planctomycetota bacterium]